MSDSSGGGGKTTGRNLPSWMSSKKSSEKTTKRGEESSRSGTLSFSKLLEGVVFALSGFVNPERGDLRSQAMEMGAEYKPDWNPDCTLLICAFINTPKFRQVVADCGTIVSKEWISECCKQKKLVAIEPYLMHVGKPWRRVIADHETTPLDKSHKQVEKNIQRKPSVAASSEVAIETHDDHMNISIPKPPFPSHIVETHQDEMNFPASGPVKEHLSPSKVKKWATDDLKETISWLESQEEKPEASEIKKIASEGILTCLQDAIESLDQNQDIQQMTEQWKFIPRVVKELARLEDVNMSKKSLKRKDLCQQAMACKRVYEMVFYQSDDSTILKKKKKADEEDETCRKIGAKAADNAYDSDETIEMTGEEIDLCYSAVASKIKSFKSQANGTLDELRHAMSALQSESES